LPKPANANDAEQIGGLIPDDPIFQGASAEQAAVCMFCLLNQA
jgi:hypothetical protein